MPGEPRRERIEPLWDRVDRNRVQLGLAIVGFALLSGASLAAFVGGCLSVVILLVAFSDAWDAAYHLSLIPGLLRGIWVLGAVIAFAWAVGMLLRSEKWLLERFGATLVPKGELLPTKYALKDMSIAAGFDVAPALWLIETGNVNAFLVAARRRRAVVGVTRGFVERLEPAEQRAVFANLIARLRSGDVIVDTGLTALLWPLHVWRESRLEADDREFAQALADQGRRVPGEQEKGPGLAALLFVFGVAFAIMAELIALGHRRSQLRRAEKADAEGMLLLKDPVSILSALEKCIRFNNVVVTAGEAFSQLFYCWTGDSADDESDPEWQRVSRLREVLGAEGIRLPQKAAFAADALMPPVAPRIEHDA